MKDIILGWALLLMVMVLSQLAARVVPRRWGWRGGIVAALILVGPMLFTGYALGQFGIGWPFGGGS